MTHSITNNDSIEIVEAVDPYWDLPGAKSEERITRGFDMEKYFGILAGSDEEDDAPGRTDALVASGQMGRSMDLYRSRRELLRNPHNEAYEGVTDLSADQEPPGRPALTRSYEARKHGAVPWH